MFCVANPQAIWFWKYSLVPKNFFESLDSSNKQLSVLCVCVCILVKLTTALLIEANTVPFCYRSLKLESLFPSYLLFSVSVWNLSDVYNLQNTLPCSLWFGSQLFSELCVKVVVITKAAMSYNKELVIVNSAEKLFFMVCFLFSFHGRTLFIFPRCQKT